MLPQPVFIKHLHNCISAIHNLHQLLQQLFLHVLIISGLQVIYDQFVSTVMILFVTKCFEVQTV